MYNNPNYQIPGMLVLYLTERKDSTCLSSPMSYRRSATKDVKKGAAGM